MKKLLLLSAVLLGAVSASQAGVRFNFGFGVPLPAPVVVAPPAPVCVTPPAPVFVTPSVCAPAPVVVTPQVCAPAPVVVAPPVVSFGFGHYGYDRFHGPYRYDFHRDYHYRR